MRLLCFNELDLILRRSRSGRLEGWAVIPICDSRYYHAPIIACVKPVHQAGDGRPVDIQTKTRTSRPGFSLMLQMKRKSSGDGPEAGAHQADAVEIGLFPGVFFSPLAGLVALVQQFDFLELL